MWQCSRRLAGAQGLFLILLLALFVPQLSLAQSPSETPETELRASEAYFLLPPPGRTMSAAFMHLENHGDKAVTVTSLQSPQLERVELHGHSHHGGMMQMRRVEQLEIDAQSEQPLAPGGYHLMLYGLPTNLSTGDRLIIELQLSSGELLRVDAVARSLR